MVHRIDHLLFIRFLQNALEPFYPPAIHLRQLRMQHNVKFGSLDGPTIHDAIPLRL